MCAKISKNEFNEYQNEVFRDLLNFFTGDDRIFILQGYAGTGKTTLIKEVVDYLKSLYKRIYLMAPTGRAAKILSQKTQYGARTVHSWIYRLDALEESETKEEDGDVSFKFRFGLKECEDIQNAVFIVDEASMVGDLGDEQEFVQFGTGCLLSDLMSFARIQDATVKSKIIFVGDPAQLPPVGMNCSPALDLEYLHKKFYNLATKVELKEVVRQNADSDILTAAGYLRSSIQSGFYNYFQLKSYKGDIINPSAEEIMPLYFADKGTKIFISYKNETALALNNRIRKELFADTSKVQEGDMIICGANNSLYEMMNGEFAVISARDESIETRDVSFYLKGGEKKSVSLVWRKISLLITDVDMAGKPKVIDAYMLENFLHGANQLSFLERRALYIDFKQRFPRLKPGSPEFIDAMKKDPYYNCLLLKYGYAVTCHKAQGGEWDSVYVYWDKGTHQNFDNEDEGSQVRGKSNLDFYRWAYTAVTRAARRLISFNAPSFNPFSKLGFVSNDVNDVYNHSIEGNGNAVEVDYDEVLPELQRFGVHQESTLIQEHFVDRWYRLKQQGISIISWQKVGYEIRYIFKQGAHAAAVKYWMDARGVIGAKSALIPGKTNSMDLFHIVTQTQDAATSVRLRYSDNAINLIQESAEFAQKLAEERPFLKLLYEKIKEALMPHETITSISHQDYRERYTIVIHGKTGVFDFEYDGAGFFGRVLFLENKSTNPDMIYRIKEIIQHIKQL
jgi:hypothetical protein